MKKRVIDTIFNTINIGVEKGLGHLYTMDQSYNGSTVNIHGEDLINFGSYSYLCLEHDIRLKKAAINSIDRFGIQFGSSRTFLSTTQYAELEKFMDEVFEAHTLLVPTTTLGHIAVMPIVVQERDIIIFDQNVHTSVQFMIKHIELQGVPNVMIRHNDMAALEAEIVKYSKNYQKIWFMADGVYSMYGDVAPLMKIDELLQKYKKFHLYVDDAHGMSWAGKNGSGYVLSKIKLTEKIVLGTSLNKAFAAGGAVFAFTDKELKTRVKTCGGPLIFSGQHLMSALGASIAASKIHLSPEIYEIQSKLKKKIEFCVRELRKRNLPDMSDEKTPIFFIGVGLPKVAYNVLKRLKKSGFHVNLAMFPAVSENCTGVRFSINTNHTAEDIVSLIEAIDFHLFAALKEEGRSVKDIERAFRKTKVYHLDENRVKSNSNELKRSYFDIQTYSSISEIPARYIRHIMNDFLLGQKALLDLEHAFSDNKLDEDNWQFTYLLAFKESVPLFFTFFTKTIIKDDILESELFSKSIETKRKTDPYYMCSQNMIMGTPVSFGNHTWKSKIVEFTKEDEENILDSIQNLFELSQANSIIIRDMKGLGFTRNTMEGMGFVLSEGLATYEIEKLGGHNYSSSLKSAQRRYVNKRAIEKEAQFETRFDKNIPLSELKKVYQLYLNTHGRNFGLNTFPYNFSLFEKANSSKKGVWDIIRIYSSDENQLVGISISVINPGKYNFLIAGLDYKRHQELDTYSQLLHQIIKRAKSLDSHSINLGYTTRQNKMKFGAKEIQNQSFSKFKDAYVKSKLSNELLKRSVD